MRQIHFELRTTARVEPGDSLWTNIERQIDGRTTTPIPSRTNGWRIGLAAACALASIAASGTVAARQGWLSWRQPVERTIGPFRVSGYFYGRMECYGADGALLAVQDTQESVPVRSGIVDVQATIRGASIAENGPTVLEKRLAREYTLRNAAGAVLGRLVLSQAREPGTENPFMTMPLKTAADADAFIDAGWKWQTSRWKTGSESVDESPIGVTGYDCRRGLIWSLRGVADVRVRAADGSDRTPFGMYGGASTGFGHVLDDAIRRYDAAHPGPEFLAVYQGRRFRAVGFGTHKLADETGIVRLIVVITPPTDNP